ncbi:Zn(II)2Cys6 transcription factor [Lineolata rhizophorae]|uniref:Zn(II)2Cys6 transcription factor n=1 Tax=Lineolata rhizophorae TaxID=578093 RepID=A0A6A6PBX7_9PEZI|nr:Zn(II)2Cys6 transcription factor [Lineolata rhizophorae]
MDSSTSTPENDPPGRRPKKACTGCRQQKVRCDVSEDHDKPCTRCRKLHLECVISEPFKREHKRQRLSELEKERDALRRRLEANQDGVHQSPIAMLSAAAELDASRSRATRILPVTPVTTNGLSSAGETHPENDTPLILVRQPSEGVSTGSGPTEPRSLCGLHLPSDVIDDLFRIYFDQYARFIPILDPNISPNAFYAQSSLLFWTIISLASRRYTKDPTISPLVATKVVHLAYESLQNTKVDIPIVQGLLLVLSWPLPKTYLTKDYAFPMAGAMIHTAMGLGLHSPLSSQDFSRVKIKLSESDINAQTELWAYCVITYQKVCAFTGHLPVTTFHSGKDPGQTKTLFKRLSPFVRFELKVYGVLTKAFAALSENGLRSLSVHQERSLAILLKVFEEQLNDLEADIATEPQKVQLNLARMTIRIFHFFRNPSIDQTTGLVSLYTSCTVVLDLINNHDEEYQLLHSAPAAIMNAVLLASHTLLRMLKGSFSQYLDFETAKSYFFLGINLSKRLSCFSNDAMDKNAELLPMIWNSPKAFHKPDGSEFTVLRIRSRLAMSAVFDSLWWWREEFAGQSGAYPPSEEDSRKDCRSFPTIQDDTSTFPIREPYSLLDDQFMAEFGWAVDENAVFPSLGVQDTGLPLGPTMEEPQIFSQ